MANTIQYQEDWENKLAQRLDKPENWMDTCKVVYTDTQTHNMPYIGTTGEPAVSTSWLASAAARSTLSNVVTLISVTESSEKLQIISTEYDAVYLDYADQAQSVYAKLMDMGTLLGKKITERVEALTLADHANWTDFGDTGGGALGLAATKFTVSDSNVDDVVRAVIEQIQTANGFDLYKENGGFITWRPSDWTNLVAFMQANGFQFADEALRDGGKGRMGKESMGLFHYVSTQHAANHLMGGVRDVLMLGLLNTTFGKTYVTETPSSSTAGFLSGTAIHTRLDYGLKVPTNLKPVIYDINVN